MLVAAIAIAGGVAAAEARPIKTRIEGRVLYLDTRGIPARYPSDFPRDTRNFRRSLRGSLHPLSAPDDILQGQRIAVDDLDDPRIGHVVTYRATVEDRDVLFQVAFEYGIYHGENSLRIPHHIGEAPALDLHVRREHRSDADAYRWFQGVLTAARPSQAELDEALQFLLARERARPDVQNYLDISTLIMKTLRVTQNLDPILAKRVAEVDLMPGFRALESALQFRVLREIALAVIRSPAPEYALELDLPVAAFGEHMMEKAIRIGRARDSGVDRSDLSKATQERYRSQCERGAIAECLKTVQDFLRGESELGAGTYRAFLVDYVNHVERISGYGPRNGGADATDNAYVRRVAGDGDLLDHWVDYYCLVTTTGHLGPVVAGKAHLRKATDLARQMLELADARCVPAVDSMVSMLED